MGRPKGSKNQEVAVLDKPVVQSEKVPIEQEIVEQVEQVENNTVTPKLTEAERRTMELEQRAERAEERTRILESQVVTKTLEEYLKDKYYGTRTYLTVTLATHKDLQGRVFHTKAALSAFPDAINKDSGEKIAPDIGFDFNDAKNKVSKKANELRESSELCFFEGEMVSIKDAIYTLRMRYYKKRLEADKIFLETQKISVD